MGFLSKLWKVFTTPWGGNRLVYKDSPEDRVELWARVTANMEPTGYVVFNLATFPGARFANWALVGEAHFTDTGVFLIGLSRLDNNAVKPIKLGGPAFLLGGVAGAITANMQETQNAKEAIKAMKRQYTSSAAKLWTMSLGERFAAAPCDVYHFNPEEIEDVIISEKPDLPSYVLTVFGMMELPAKMTEEDREALRAWREHYCPVARQGIPSAVWTIGKAALFMRKNVALHERLLPFLVEVGSDPIRSQQLCQVLSNGQDRTRYWAFVDQVSTQGGAPGTALAFVAAKHQRRKALWKIPAALLCFLGAIGIVWASLLALSVESDGGGGGSNAFFLAFICLGVLLFLLGIILTWVAVGDFARSRRYLLAKRA